MTSNFIAGPEYGELIIGSEQEDSILSLGGHDYTIGLESDDFINGNQGNDTVNGNIGNDIVHGGQGDDIAHGGQDDDWVYGDKGNDTMWGDKGNDNVFGGLGSPLPVGPLVDQDLIFGNTGNDYLNGNEGNDTVYGGQADDLLHGGKDDDWLHGDLGNDTVHGDLGNDTIYGGPADPVRVLLDGNDLLLGHSGVNLMQGNVGDDTIFGGIGVDVIYGGQGEDLMLGNVGSDILFGDKGDDTIFGGTGMIEVGDPEGDDFIVGGEGNDYLHGNEGDDTILGGNGCNIIRGGQGNDLIYGEECNDLLYGDKGSDNLIGGDGADVFVIGVSSGSPTLAEADHILDFGNGYDLIGLDPGQTLDNLEIFQGEGEYAAHAIVQDRTTGDFLAIVHNTDATTLTPDRFTMDLDLNCECDQDDVPPVETLGMGDLRPEDMATEVSGEEGPPSVIFGPLPQAMQNQVATGQPGIILGPVPQNPTPTGEPPMVIVEPTPPLVSPPVVVQPEPEPEPQSNLSPTVGNPLGDQNATPGEEFSFAVPTDTFSDPDGDPLTFSATLAGGSPLPEWLSFNPATGTLSGTPDNEDIGNLEIEVTADDSQGGTVSDSFELAVNDGINDGANEPPTVGNPLGDQNATPGEEFSFAVPTDTFRDPDGDSLTFSATLADGSPLPEWLSFDPVTGTLSGTPDNEDIGNLEIEVTADDGQGGTVSDSFELAVNDGINDGANEPPSLSDVAITSPEGTAYTFDPNDFINAFSDPDGDNLEGIQIISLPENGTLNLNGAAVEEGQEIQAEEIGNLTFTPNPDAPGDASFTWNGFDGTEYSLADGTVNLSVSPVENIPPEVNLDRDAPGVDTSVTFDPEVAGVPIAANALVTDPDSENNTLTEATIRLTNPIDGDAEELSVDTEGTNITATFENGELRLTGTDEVENYERVLQRVRYNNTSLNPDLSPRAIEILVSDGVNQSPPAIATVEFPAAAALEVTKTVSDAEATIGEELSYTVTLTNQGVMPATGITVTESLPNWLRDITFTPTEGNNYDPAADEWTIPRLEGGETTTLTISGILSRWGTIPNRARVTAFDQGEPDGQVALAQAISPLPAPDISLSNMSLGYGGLVIYGENEEDLSGRNISSAGDINSDGFNDILIGTRFGDRPDGTASGAGRGYVIFGGPDIGPQIDLRDLDGSNGFAIYGVDEGDFIGRALSNAGDLNGDGFDDIMVASRFADGPNNDRPDTGETYIIFGGNQFDAPINLATLDGNNGFTIFGREAGDQSGRDVHAGDINGDGVDDLLIGAFSADGPNNERPEAGETYVIFGGSDFTFDAEMDLANLELDGTNGFTVFGSKAGDRSGRSPRSAGDLNGDGYNDLLIGAPQADDDDEEAAGETYLVYGGPTFNATVDLAEIDGTNGIRILGINAGDLSGRALSNAGDINGDGLDDMIIGAQGANNEAGESYVIFGSTNLPATLELGNLNGTNGFTISGINAGDLSGRSVSNAGDINGDGYDDLIINASLAPGLEGEEEAGQSYVLFGGTTFSPSLNFEQIDGTNGFTLYGIEANNRTGRSVSAGDVNGDGFDDVLVGAPEGDGPNGTRENAGETYVMYGGDFTGDVTHHGGVGNDFLTGTAGADVIVGAQGDDTLIGAGGPDVIYGGSGNHLIAISDSDFRRLEGGSGEDTLRLDGDNFAFDLRTIANNRIHDIETIDLNGGNNSLTLDQLHVLHLSDRRNRVIVKGEQTNAVTASGNWVAGDTQVIGNDTYNVYTSGYAQLWVEEAIAQDGIAMMA